MKNLYIFLCISIFFSNIFAQISLVSPGNGSTLTTPPANMTVHNASSSQMNIEYYLAEGVGAYSFIAIVGNVASGSDATYNNYNLNSSSSYSWYVKAIEGGTYGNWSSGEGKEGGDFWARKVIHSNDLNADGNLIRIKVESASPVWGVDPTSITSAWIGEQASSGDAYDIDGSTITQIYFGGSSGITVPLGDSAYSDWTGFTFVYSKTYVISLGCSGGVFAWADGDGTYYAPDNTQAGTPDLPYTDDHDAKVWVFNDLEVANSGSEQTSSTWTFSTNETYPVELSTFTGKFINNGVTLNWTTKTEINNYGFEIERKERDFENSIWGKIGFIQGNGNSNSQKEYSFIDKTVSSGKYSYRLKQIDTDGKYKYSDPILVEVSSKPKTYNVTNYPNPFNPETIIHFELPEASFVNLSVYNIVGQKIVTLVDEFLNEGIYERTFSSKINNIQLPSGIYFYRLMTNNQNVISKKLILMK